MARGKSNGHRHSLPQGPRGYDPFEAVYFGGLNIPKSERWQVIFRPGLYLYEPSNNTFINPGTGTFVVNQDVLHIDPNSDFMLVGASIYNVVNQAAPGIEPSLDFNIQIADDRGYQIYGNFMNAAVVGVTNPGSSIAGTGLIISYKTPHILRAGGKLYLSFNGFTTILGANIPASAVQIAFTGIKVYRVKKGIV